MIVKDACMLYLQIRQTTSALVYGIVLLPLLHGWGFTVSLFTSGTGWLLPVIAIAAFFATLSYLCYYRAIAAIGASKSMALNVTYAAWAIFFTAVFLGDTSVLTPTTIVCALIVIVCGILTAGHWILGWRGRKALAWFWILCGVYVIAYLGYAFFLEYIPI